MSPRQATMGGAIVGDLFDDAGNLLLGASLDAGNGGLGPALRRFITSGLYNGDFALDTANQGVVTPDNPLPFWTWTVASGSSVSADLYTDLTAASGKKLTWRMIPGGAGDDAYLEQIVPVNGSRGQSYVYQARAYFFTGAAVNAMECYLTAQYLKKDQVTTTGTATTSSSTTTAIGASSNTDLRASPNGGIMPTDAYYLRVRFGFRRGAEANGSSGSVDTAEVRLEWGPTWILFADRTNPATYAHGILAQTGGVLYLIPNYPGWPGATVPDIRMDASNGKIVLNAGPTGTNLIEFWGPLVGANAATGAISANTNDWNPTDLHRALRVRANPNAAWNLTGINAGSTGEAHYLSNVASGAGVNLTLVHQSASSAVGNRFLCPNNANVILRPNASLWIFYDGDWRVEGA